MTGIKPMMLAHVANSLAINEPAAAWQEPESEPMMWVKSWAIVSDVKADNPMATERMRTENIS